jgi:hypothetical protein
MNTNEIEAVLKLARAQEMLCEDVKSMKEGLFHLTQAMVLMNETLESLNRSVHERLEVSRNGKT